MTEKYMLIIPFIGIGVVLALFLIPAYSEDIYILESSGIGDNSTVVNRIESDNNAIIVSAPFGNVTLSPLWRNLGSYELASSNTVIQTANFTAHKRYMVTVDLITNTNTLVTGLRFNGDSGNSYSWRASLNGGADATGTNDTECQPIGANAVNTGAVNSFTFFIDNNIETDRKVVHGFNSGDSATGDGSAPSRGEFACKWDNTTDYITSIQFTVASGSGQYSTGSRIVVWAYGDT